MIRRAKISPAEAAHGGRGQHTLGSAAAAHDRMDPAADHRRPDGRGEIAVADESNAARRRPGFRQSADSCRYAIEHDHDEVLDVPVEAPGDLLQVVRDRRIEIHRVLRLRSDDQLLHVNVGRVQQPAPLGGGQHGDRTRGSGGAEVRALEGVDGDIDFGQPSSPFAPRPTRSPMKSIGAWSRSPSPMTTRPSIGTRSSPRAHRFHRNPVGTMAIALTHRVRAGNRRLLDHIQKPVRELLAGGRHACTASRYGGS